MFYEILFGDGLAKEASGKMMEVAFSNLEQSGKVRVRCTRGVVWMPDCKAYRAIINGKSGKSKARLVQKFFLNKPVDVEFSSCDARIVS